MSSSEELFYSAEASATRYYFYQPQNDLNIFIEDRNKEYEYETIFKRLLGDQYCITAIFSCGGKHAVKNIFKEFGSESSGKTNIKNFYIVDGDFDKYIAPADLIMDPCFIYLDAYNIETYFLDETACVQFAKGRLKQTDADVKKIVNFEGWKTKIVEQASKLFLCYCFVQKYHPTMETISRSAYTFIDCNTGFERTDGAYQEYWKSILSLDSEAEERIRGIADAYEQINNSDYLNLICGKFLLTGLCCYLRAIVGSKFSHGDFRWHLVNHFDIAKLDYIKARLQSVVVCA